MTETHIKVKIETDGKYCGEWCRHKKYLGRDKHGHGDIVYAMNHTFRLISNTRDNQNNALRKQGIKKTARTLYLTGCTDIEYKDYIESKFLEGMSFKNRHLWDIDHIVPCAYFDLSDIEQQKQCFHYLNQTPIWKSDNRKKGSLYKGVRHVHKQFPKEVEGYLDGLM